MPYKLFDPEISTDMVITLRRHIANKILEANPKAISIYIPESSKEWGILQRADLVPALVCKYEKLPRDIRDSFYAGKRLQSDYTCTAIGSVSEPPEPSKPNVVGMAPTFSKVTPDRKTKHSLGEWLQSLHQVKQAKRNSIVRIKRDDQGSGKDTNSDANPFADAADLDKEDEGNRVIVAWLVHAKDLTFNDRVRVFETAKTLYKTIASK